MLWSEFIEGTKCRENNTNYKVYLFLNEIYMEKGDMSKAEVYEYGKKLVDNRKTIEEIKLEMEVREKMTVFQNEIDECQKKIELFNGNKIYIKSLKDDIKYWKRKVNECKFILGGDA